jgi:hypothetical protein
MQAQNIIELRRQPNREGGCWEAYYLGPHAKRITELFGIPALPTAFTDRAPAEKVLAAIQRLNPDCVVTLSKFA